MTKRYCTMPKVPWFRDWFEEKFGDLCKTHDEDYYKGKCKLCSDIAFVKGIFSRGYWFLTPFVFIFINMPWVWYWYLRRPKNGIRIVRRD